MVEDANGESDFMKNAKRVLSLQINHPDHFSRHPRLFKKLVHQEDLEILLNFVPDDVEKLFRDKYTLPILTGPNAEFQEGGGPAEDKSKKSQADLDKASWGINAFDGLRSLSIKKKANQVQY